PATSSLIPYTTLFRSDHRHFKAHHFFEVAGDSFALTALFGFEAGKCAGGVYEGDDGFAEFFGDAHEPEGFAIAFGVGHAEITKLALFGISSLLLSDQHVDLAADGAESANHGLVVAY